MLRMPRIVLTFATLVLPAAGLLLGGAEARANGYGGGYGWGYGRGYGGRVIDPGRPGGRVFIDPGRPGGRLYPAYDRGLPGGRVYALPGSGFYHRHGHYHNGRFCYDRNCYLYRGYYGY